MKRMKRRGRREAEGIPSKACFGAAIQSVANTTQSEETDEEKVKVREQRSRSRRHSVESLLRSRHSVGSEYDQLEETKETDE
jgi:hypothetical protein